MFKKGMMRNYFYLLIFLYFLQFVESECVIDGKFYNECCKAEGWDPEKQGLNVRCVQCNYDIQCCHYTKYNATDPECGNHGEYCP